MSTTRDVAVFVGSLRKESFNRKMANALVAMAAAPLKLEIVEIR
jgi:chromate reductase